ncbi:MAG: hypothetical protein R3Y13_04180 [bacterium]
MKKCVFNIINVLLLISVINVEAALYNEGEYGKVDKVGDNKITSSSISIHSFTTSVSDSSRNRDYDTYEYNVVMNRDNGEFEAYCIDPHKWGYGDGTTHKIMGVLTERGSALSSPRVMMFDTGINAMLDYSYTNAGLSADELYTARLLALRAWVFNFGYYEPLEEDSSIMIDYSSEKKLVSAYTNLAVYWNTNTLSSLSNQAQAHFNSEYSNTEELVKTSYEDYIGTNYIVKGSGGAYDHALAMYEAALVSTLATEEQIAYFSKDETYQSSVSGTIIKRFTFTAGNITETEHSYISYFELHGSTTDSRVNAECSIFDKSEGETNTYASCSELVADQFQLEEDDIFIVDLTVDGDPDNCDPAAYDVSFGLTDESIRNVEFAIGFDVEFGYKINGSYSDLYGFSGKRGYIMNALGIQVDAAGEEFEPQRFLFFDDFGYDDDNGPTGDINGGGISSSIFTGNISLNTEITRIYNVSGDIQTCLDDCDTVITIPADCVDEDLDKAENRDEYYTGKVEVNGSIDACVIDKTDDAGNTYNVNTCNYANDTVSISNGMETVSNNKYCTVSCVENYDRIDLSGVKDADSGRYFRIDAFISGTKSCYTSEIDHELFWKEVREATLAMVEGYNEWQRQVNAIEVYEEEMTDQVTCNNVTKDCEYFNVYLGRTETTIDQGIKYNYQVNGSGDVTLGSQTTQDVQVRENISDGCDTACCNSLTQEELDAIEADDELELPEWPDSTQCLVDSEGNEVEGACNVTGVPNNGDVEDLKKERDEAISAALTKMTTAQAKYNTAIANIQGCIDWNMYFPIDPVIYYDYGMDVSFNRVDDYMTLEGITEDGSNIMVANSTLEFTDSAELTYCSSINADGGCDSITAPTQDGSFAYCSTLGCTTKTPTIPKTSVKYAKAELSKEITYNTPDIFYVAFPTGEVVYSLDDLLTEGDEETQFSLIDGLPVKISTVKGRYKFSLKIENFGEYYNSCEGGRLNDVSSATVAVNGYDNEYVCYYVVNCLDCPPTTELTVCDPEVDDCCNGVCCPEDVCCDTCIVDGNFTMFFRPISLNNSSSSGSYEGMGETEFNPNDRNLGYNWNTNTGYGIIDGKAEATLEQIYTNGNKTYAGEPILVVELSPTVAVKIREENENYSSYSEDTLTCYDFTHDSILFENVFCYSNLIDKWLDTHGEDVFKFSNRQGNINVDVSANEGSYWQAYVVDITTEYSIGAPAWK